MAEEELTGGHFADHKALEGGVVPEILLDFVTVPSVDEMTQLKQPT